MSRTLDLIREEVELEGFEPGTPTFERVFLARRVTKCQDIQRVGDCTACKYSWYCELAAQQRMSAKFGELPK